MFSWDLAAVCTRIIGVFVIARCPQGESWLYSSLKFTDGWDEIYVGFSENLLSRLLTKEKITHYPRDEKN